MFPLSTQEKHETETINRTNKHSNPLWFIDQKHNIFRTKTLNKMNKIPQNNTHQIHEVPTKVSISLTLRTCQNPESMGENWRLLACVADLGGRGYEEKILKNERGSYENPMKLDEVGKV